MAHDEIPDWMKGWNEYRRTLDEDAEERAYEAGFRRGRASALERDRGRFEEVPGTIQWAVTQVLEGRQVESQTANIRILLPPDPNNLQDQFVPLRHKAILATDWELVETPDSPCPATMQADPLGF